MKYESSYESFTVAAFREEIITSLINSIAFTTDFTQFFVV